MMNNRTILALSGKQATLTVREALLQQSLAGNKCYRAGERITEPDCQGEEGRAGNNRQSKTKKKLKRTLRYAHMHVPHIDASQVQSGCQLYGSCQVCQIWSPVCVLKEINIAFAAVRTRSYERCK